MPSNFCATVASVTNDTVKRTTVRALPPPVALDADDQALARSGGGLLPRDTLSSPDALAYLERRGIGRAMRLTASSWALPTAPWG